jgi:hypothetical protein
VPLVTVVGNIILAGIVWYNGRGARDAAEAAKKAAEKVQTDLAANTTSTDDQLASIHNLVNSESARQRTLIARLEKQLRSAGVVPESFPAPPTRARMPTTTKRRK